MDKLLNNRQFANAIGVAPSTVSLMIKRGEVQMVTDVNGNTGIPSSQVIAVMKAQVVKKYAKNGVLYINVKSDSLTDSSVHMSSSAKCIVDIDKCINDLIFSSLDALHNDEMLTKRFIPEYKEAIIDEFIKRYETGANAYMYKLVKDYPKLGELQYAELRDFLFTGVVAEASDLEGKFKESGADFQATDTRMKEFFSSLVQKLNIYWSDKSAVLNRENMTPDFFKKESKEYNLIFYKEADNDLGFHDAYPNGKAFAMADEKGNSLSTESVKIAKVIEARIMKTTHFSSVDDLLKNGYYSVVDISSDLSDTENDALYDILMSGFYGKVVLNFDKASAEQYLPSNLFRPLMQRFGYKNVFFRDTMQAF